MKTNQDYRYEDPKEEECATRTQVTPPKLSIFSLPPTMNYNRQINYHEPPPPTPPLHALASIPFQWEEAPGKPRPPLPSTTTGPPQPGKPKAARCLELPPRLQSTEPVAKIMIMNMANNLPSPTTVLDGPDVLVSVGGKGRSFNSSSSLSKKVTFGSSRWGSFRKSTISNISTCESSSYCFAGDCICSTIGNNNYSTISHDNHTANFGLNNDRKVKFTIDLTRKSSFLAMSSKSSHLWTSFCEGLKQVVPWRRRQEKLRKSKSFNVNIVV